MQQPPDPFPQYPKQPPFPPQQYQQPLQYQPSLPPQKKKSRKGLFIVPGVILAVALFGCIGISAMVNAGGQAAQQTLNQTSTQVTQLPTMKPTTQPTTKPTQARRQYQKFLFIWTLQFKMLLRAGHMVSLKVA